MLRLTGTTSNTTPPTDATTASPAHQQILAVFAATTNPLRAKDICIALGTGTAAKNTESQRAKLKRLVARDVHRTRIRPVRPHPAHDQQP